MQKAIIVNTQLIHSWGEGVALRQVHKQFPNHRYTELETTHVCWMCAFGEVNHGKGDPVCGERTHSSKGLGGDSAG